MLVVHLELCAYIKLDGRVVLSFPRKTLRLFFIGMKEKGFGRIVNTCSLAAKTGGITAGALSKLELMLNEILSTCSDCVFRDCIFNFKRRNADTDIFASE